MSGLTETKFEIPVLLPRLVARMALMNQLDRVLEGRLAVVSAPAGFGKTTLLGQWCQTALDRGVDVAWLSLGEGENEPGSLLDHIIRALGRVSDQIIANLPAIVEASPTLPVDVILTRLINGITAWKRELVLAIDDAHFLTDPEVGAILDALLAYPWQPSLSRCAAILLASSAVPREFLAQKTLHGRWSLLWAECPSRVARVALYPIPSPALSFCLKVSQLEDPRLVEDLPPSATPVI